MPSGGHNKKRDRSQPGPMALAAWPPAPKSFTKREIASWERIGIAVMALGSVGESDMMLAERLAQLHARNSQALADPDVQMTSLSAALRLEADLCGRMGLTPQARNTIGPLSRAKPKSALDEF